MQPGEKRERLLPFCTKRARVDAELVVQFPDGRPGSPRGAPGGHHLLGVVHLATLPGRSPMQRVTAARIRPDAIERDLARGALLEEQSVVRIKQKHRECAVEEAGLCVKPVGVVLGGMTGDGVGGGDEDDVVVAHKLLLCLVGVPGAGRDSRGAGHDVRPPGECPGL